MHRPGLALSLARFFWYRKTTLKDLSPSCRFQGSALSSFASRNLLYSGGGAGGGAGAGKDLVEATRLIRVDESSDLTICHIGTRL